MRSRAGRTAAAVAALLAAPPAARAGGPTVEHQAVPCTVPGQPFSLCAAITDDVQVSRARVYFRPAGERHFSFVDMGFGGLRFCGTLPAPRPGKVKRIEYYVQGLDNDYDTERTPTHSPAGRTASTCVGVRSVS